MLHQNRVARGSITAKNMVKESFLPKCVGFQPRPCASQSPERAVLPGAEPRGRHTAQGCALLCTCAGGAVYARIALT